MQEVLQKIFREAKLPTSPALALRILELSRDPDASVADFCALLKSDPALTGRLLKAANTSETGQVQPVTRLERAVTLLGTRRVRSLSLGFQLVAHLDKLGGASFDMVRFWQHSFLRACVGRSIAETFAPEIEEEAFLIGLLQDCGILILVQVLGASYASILQSDHLSPAALFELEQASFPYTHTDAAAALFNEWGLPQAMADPIALHHTRPDFRNPTTPEDKLLAISYITGNVCFDTSQQRSNSDSELHEFARDVLGFDAECWQATLNRAMGEYSRGAAIYGGGADSAIDVVELLGEANRQLSRVADESEVCLFDLRAEQERILGTHQRVAKSLREYRERAALDPLTGAFNRGALAETLRSMMDHPKNQPDQYCMLFLDLDDFKKINDEFGHQAGDAVLRAVANILQRESMYDAIVTRFGGEEFLLIYPGVTPEIGRDAAERVLKGVRALDPEAMGIPRHVTCSIGVAWTDLVSTRWAEDMIAHADELMYRAKRSGKDQFCFQAFHGADMSRDHLSRVAPNSSAAATAGINITSDDETLEELVAVAARISDSDYPKIVGLRKEKRESVFMPCRIEILAQIDESLGFELGVIRDFSTGGAGIVTARPLVRGESVEVEFGTGNMRHNYRGIVSFCRAIEEHFHHIGVQFVPTGAGSACNEITQFDPASAN